MSVKRRRVPGGTIETQPLPGGWTRYTLVESRAAPVNRRPKLERRPVENPAEARAAALESIRFTDGEAAYQKALRKAGAPKGRTSAQAKRAKRRRTGVPVVSYLQIAKARRAKAGTRAHPGSDASVEGEEDTPRYTDAQVTQLGREGKAYKKKDGTYSYPVKDRRDLLNALAAWKLGRVAKGEASAVKAFIKRRAVLMRLEALLPKSWQIKVPATLPLHGGEQ